MSTETIHGKIKRMAEAYADKCFTRNSFRWQKVVQYYTQGINDWIGNAIMEDLQSQEDKPPFSMPTLPQEPFNQKP